MGGHGNVSVTANVAPRLMADMCRLALAGVTARLLYTSDAADDPPCVFHGGRRRIKQTTANQPLPPPDKPTAPSFADSMQQIRIETYPVTRTIL